MASLRSGRGVQLLMPLAGLMMAFMAACVAQVESDDSVPQIEARLFGIRTGNPLELYTNKKGNKLNLRSINFNTCGWNNNSLVLHTLQHRHNSDGDIILNLSLSTNIDIESPLKMNIKLLKKLGNNYLEIPCMFGLVGSCNFTDLCEFSQDTCPLKELDNQRFPCKCPIKHGVYRLSNAVFPLPRMPHAELLKGEYIITVTLSNQTRALSCYKFFVNLDVFPVPD